MRCSPRLPSALHKTNAESSGTAMGCDDSAELAPVNKGKTRNLHQPLKKACHGFAVVRFGYRKPEARTFTRSIFHQFHEPVHQPLRGADLFDGLNLTFHQL